MPLATEKSAVPAWHRNTSVSADGGLSDDQFVACKTGDYLDDGLFKYRVDFGCAGSCGVT